MNTPAKLDHQYVWHPFTQMRDWLKREPIVIVEGKGAILRDAHGREYLDANSSIWTNLHGHNHPKINAAIRSQLKKIAHSSALGLASEPAARLAARLVEGANTPLPTSLGTGARPQTSSRPAAPGKLRKVFFSDDGSTAMEVALKLAFEFTRRARGIKKPKFLSMQGAYHGDTVGAVSLGQIDLFHKAYQPLLFKTDRVRAPYCYRCPWNRAKPERADAREYRKCNWECVSKVEQVFERQKRGGTPYAAFAFEPLIQGAAGMIPQPKGWLKRVCAIARSHGTLLISDEVLTGFGRAGGTILASGVEGLNPDFVALAKGLSGGYLPVAATLTTQAVFNAFLGEYAQFRTFFHGHSYTANQLGCAAALASLDVLQSPASLRSRTNLGLFLREGLAALWDHPNIGDIRQVGLVAGIELVKHWRSREPFPLEQQAGIRVCEAMARRGVLTLPIGNVLVLMPPYCTSQNQVETIISALKDALHEVFSRGNR